MEAVSWCRALPEDIRTRLESDLARLRSEDDDLEGLIDGPLGDLLARFSGLIGLDFPAREPDAPDFSAEFRELKEADPLWFANLEGFLDSLDETGDRDEE